MISHWTVIQKWKSSQRFDRFAERNSSQDLRRSRFFLIKNTWCRADNKSSRCTRQDGGDIRPNPWRERVARDPPIRSVPSKSFNPVEIVITRHDRIRWGERGQSRNFGSAPLLFSVSNATPGPSRAWTVRQPRLQSRGVSQERLMPCALDIHRNRNNFWNERRPCSFRRRDESKLVMKCYFLFRFPPSFRLTQWRVINAFF